MPATSAGMTMKYVAKFASHASKVQEQGMRPAVGIAVLVIAVGSAHAHDAGQKVTAKRAAMACKSAQTLGTLRELMDDKLRFGNFWLEQKRSGECRTFPLGTEVIVEQDLRSKNKDGVERGIMRARAVGEEDFYWTPPYFYE